MITVTPSPLKSDRKKKTVNWADQPDQPSEPPSSPKASTDPFKTSSVYTTSFKDGSVRQEDRKELLEVNEEIEN